MLRAVTQLVTKIARFLSLAGVALAMLLAARTSAAEPEAPRAKVVVVTNYVTVTNYVFVSGTNTTVTNAMAKATGTNKPSALPPLDWVPPQDKFDWIQLKSGEWLKGEIKAMQDRELEFDSDELDDLTFDWADIRQVRSARPLKLLFVDGNTASAQVNITPKKISVTGAPDVTYDRSELLGITPASDREISKWSGKVSAGLTVRSGNTEQVDYNAQARLQRRTPATRFSFDYIGNISETDGLESANNHRANSEFDVWLSRRLFLVVPGVEYYRDPFQNLEHRLTAGVGAGYDLIDRPKLEWNITAGPAYQRTYYVSVQPGEDDVKDTAALTFGTHFDWDVTSRVEFIFDYRGVLTSRDAGETTHHTVGTFSIEVTKRLDLDLSLVWDRVTNPKPDATGVEPKPDDFRLIVGLGLDF